MVGLIEQLKERENRIKELQQKFMEASSIALNLAEQLGVLLEEEEKEQQKEAA